MQRNAFFAASRIMSISNIVIMTCSTNDVATMAKPPPQFNGRTSMPIARPGGTGQGSLQRMHQFHLQHTHGAGDVQPDSRRQTKHHTHGAGTVHLDSRQQLGLSGSTTALTSTLPTSYLRTGNHYSHTSSGTTSRGQKARRQST